MFTVNGHRWKIEFVDFQSDKLRRSDGSKTIGVTDNNLKEIFLASGLSDHMTDKVLCHELTHVFSFEYNYDIDIDTEEIIADFMSLFGRDIIYLADDIMQILHRRIA